MKPSQALIQELRSTYPGTRDRRAHQAWQAAVYREANKVRDVEREVFVSMCLSAHLSSGRKGD